MALDTRDKRASALGIDAIYRVVYPDPDGAAITVLDRQQTAAKYRGVDSSGGPPPVGDDAAPYIVIFRRRRGR